MTKCDFCALGKGENCMDYSRQTRRSACLIASRDMQNFIKEIIKEGKCSINV